MDMATTIEKTRVPVLYTLLSKGLKIEVPLPDTTNTAGFLGIAPFAVRISWGN